MYAELADVYLLLDEDTLITLTDDEGMEAVNPGRVEAALTAASETIDSYLPDEYVIPLDPVPARITTICCQIGGYLLHVRRDMVSDIWQTQYNDAIRWLEKVQAGEIELKVTTVGNAAGSIGQEMQVAAPAQCFPEEELEKY